MVIRSPKVLRLWLLGVPPHPQVRIHGCTSATRRITQKIFIPGLPIKSCFIYRLILVVQFNNFVPTSKGSQRGTYEKSNHSLLACKTVELPDLPYLLQRLSHSLSIYTRLSRLSSF